MISFAQSYIFSPIVRRIWSDSATLQRWLDVESALAEAQAEVGMIPVEAAAQIRGCARADRFNLVELSDAIAVAQHPLTPVLKEFVKLCGEPGGGWIHWGATTQNILDTAQSVQMAATAGILSVDLNRLIERLRELANEHSGSLQAGRTHGQHALPITFGFKVSGWITEFERHAARLTLLRDLAFVVRLGGAVGSYAAMGGRGREVERIVARILDLPVAGIGGRSDGDRQAEYVSFLGMLAGTCEKVATDLLFMQRTEIAELEEHHYVGRAGSSTMAQKRNPQEAQRVIMLARMTRSRVPLALEAMVRQDEGDAVPAHVMDYSLPETSIFGASMLQALFALFVHLKVRPARMEQTLRSSGGLIMAEAVVMALGESLGRDRAHHLVQQAARATVEKDSDFVLELRERAAKEGIPAEKIENGLFDPRAYLGEIDAIVREVANRR